MHRASLRAVLAAAFALALVLGSVPSARAAERSVPGKLPTGEMLLPNGRLLTPAGTQTEVAPYPFALALTPDGTRVVAACTGADDQSLHLLDAATGKVLAKEPVKKSWLGLAISPDGKRVYLAGAGAKVVLAYRLENDRFVAEDPLPLRKAGEPVKLDATPSGLAVSPDGKSLWAARILLNDLVRIDLVSGTVASSVPVGVHPYRPVLSPDGTLLAVSNWGAATVSLVDAATATVVGTVRMADHPSDLLFSRDGRTLFVAQSNRNLVAAVDVAARDRRAADLRGARARRTRHAVRGRASGRLDAECARALPGREDPLRRERGRRRRRRRRHRRRRPFGPDEGLHPQRLVSRRARALRGREDALGREREGGGLLVERGRRARPDEEEGQGLEEDADDPGDRLARRRPRGRRRSRRSRRAPTRTAAPPRGPRRARKRPPSCRRPAASSPIRHVVYVIRENRTYDQVLGDLPQGNGDPALAIFGRDVTPNAHALAEEFVLLDNLYCDAEVSADGHNWSMGAYATDFVEKVWPPDYGSKGFDYLFEGNDANAFPTNGYLWDAAARAGLTLRNYGEFVGVAAEMEPTVLSLSEGMEGALAGNTCPFYPGFDLDVLDNSRVDIFLKEFRGFVKKKEMPRLTILRLGNDHTAGTKKGERTPRAMVAENDVALGRLVEAISHSPFWKDTAIFVIEDDAQNGSDHVDAHRTVGFVISPYTRRKGAVDSTMYATVSMLRTMELILGLPPLSQHDAGATPMGNAFADVPDFAPYVHRETKIPFYEMNSDGAPMQEAANTWDFSKEDAAPELALNEAVWKSVRGRDAEMPAPVNASFVRLREKTDD
jgi:YVTN family beta-propeller protein